MPSFPLKHCSQFCFLGLLAVDGFGILEVQSLDNIVNAFMLRHLGAIATLLEGHPESFNLTLHLDSMWLLSMRMGGSLRLVLNL